MDNLCPECEESQVEDYNIEVPGVCDRCQEYWEPNDYGGDW